MPNASHRHDLCAKRIGWCTHAFAIRRGHDYTASKVPCTVNGPDRTQNRSTDPKNSGVKTNAMIDNSGPELDAANVTPKILIAIDVVSRRLSNRRSHFMDGRVNISHGRRGIVDEQQQLVVVHNPGVGDVHDVFGPHLETGGEQHT